MLYDLGVVVFLLQAMIRLMDIIKQHFGVLGLYNWFATKGVFGCVSLDNVFSLKGWQKNSSKL